MYTRAIISLLEQKEWGEIRVAYFQMEWTRDSATGAGCCVRTGGPAALRELGGLPGPPVVGPALGDPGTADLPRLCPPPCTQRSARKRPQGSQQLQPRGAWLIRFYSWWVFK